MNRKNFLKKLGLGFLIVPAVPKIMEKAAEHGTYRKIHTYSGDQNYSAKPNAEEFKNGDIWVNCNTNTSFKLYNGKWVKFEW